MRYSLPFSNALLIEGHRLRSFDWTRAQRLDFIALYRMGGEL